MDRASLRRVGAALSGLLIASAACRDREVQPRHNRNLGGEGQYLLPTTPGPARPALTGNRPIVIPDRANAAQVKARPAEGKAGQPAEPTAPGEGGEKEGGKKGVVSKFLNRLKGITSPSSDAGQPVPPPED